MFVNATFRSRVSGDALARRSGGRVRGHVGAARHVTSVTLVSF